jgi:hypothetical protein
MAKRLEGSCHCGATRFEVPTPPENVTRCNCTFCSKRGALWAYYAPEQFKLLSQGHEVAYQREGWPNRHLHCGVCGCGTYTESPEWVHGKADPVRKKVGVNARLFNDFDLDSVPVRFIDGKNLW